VTPVCTERPFVKNKNLQKYSIFYFKLISECLFLFKNNLSKKTIYLKKIDLKNRIEMSNCLIMSEQSNVKFLGKEFCDEDFV